MICRDIILKLVQNELITLELMVLICRFVLIPDVLPFKTDTDRSSHNWTVIMNNTIVMVLYNVSESSPKNINITGFTFQQVSPNRQLNNPEVTLELTNLTALTGINQSTN